MRSVHAITLVLTLVACDSDARAEADALREQLAAQRVTLTATQSEVAALTARLAAQPGPQVHDRSPSADPIADAAPTGAPSPITCVGARCTIARVALDALVNDPLALARTARLIPSLKDGQTVGYKLYGIRPNNPFTALDLKNGDLLTEVAGHPLSTTDSALLAYQQLKTLDEWKIKGMRDGAAFERTIVVQK